MMDIINDLREKTLDELETLLYDVIANHADKDLILETYEFAKCAHASINQLRDDGKPYIVHPLRIILMAIMIYDHDEAPILQGMLLHDVVEDTAITREDVKAKFGDKVAYYVDKLTRDRDPNETPDEKSESKKRKFAKVMKSELEVRLMNVMDLIDNTCDWPYIADDSPTVKKFPRWMGQLQKSSIPLAETVGPKYVKPLQETFDVMTKKGFKPQFSDFKM